MSTFTLDSDSGVYTRSLRALAVIPFAFLITFVLLFIMVKLVFIEIQELEEPEPLPQFDLTFKPEEPELIVDNKPAKPEEVESVPDRPDMNTEELDGDVDLTLTGHKVKLPEGNAEIAFSSVPVEQFVVSAKYPRAALQRGIEGYVDVKFDITEIGLTKNIQVIGANPEKIFDKAALNAVRKWRYKPQLNDGEAQYFEGMVKRIRFELAK